MVSTTDIEDIVQMESDVLQVLRTASLVFLHGRGARHARSAWSARLLVTCFWRKIPVFGVPQEKFVRFVRMAGRSVRIGRGSEPRTAGVRSMVVGAHPGAGGEETAGICVLCGVDGVRDVGFATPLEVHGCLMRVLRVLHV